MNKLVQLKHVTEGAWGRSSQAAGGFFVIFWKKMAILKEVNHPANSRGLQ